MAVLTEEQKIIIGITVGVGTLVLLWILVFICCIHYGRKRRRLYKRYYKEHFIGTRDYNGYTDGRPYTHKRFFKENFISNKDHDGSINGRPYKHKGFFKKLFFGNKDYNGSMHERPYTIYEQHITHTNEAPAIPPSLAPQSQHQPPDMRSEEYHKKAHSLERIEMRHDSWDRTAKDQPPAMRSNEYHKTPHSLEQIEMHHGSWDGRTVPQHVEKRYHRTYEQEVAPHDPPYIHQASHSHHIYQAPALYNDVYHNRLHSLEPAVIRHDSWDRKVIPQQVEKRYYSDNRWSGDIRTDPIVVHLTEPEYVVNDIDRREQDIIYLKYTDDQALLPRTNHYRRADYGEIRRARSFTDLHRIAPYGGEWYRRPDHFGAKKYRYIDDQALLSRTNHYRAADYGAIRRARSFTDLQEGTYPYVGEWYRRPDHFEFNKYALKAGRDPFLWKGYPEIK